MKSRTCWHHGVLIALAAALSAGCIKTVEVRSMQPGRYNLGATNEIVLLDGNGRRSAREFVSAEVTSQARSDGYFNVEERLETGTQIQLAGRQGRAMNPTREVEPLRPNQVFVQLDVLEWDADRDTVEREVRDSEGNARIVEDDIYRGRALLGATILDPEGRAVVAEKEYEAAMEISPEEGGRDLARELAGREAVARFLNDITPRTVVRKVRLDDSDKAQKPYIKTARAGNLQQAASDFESYLEQNPNNGPALYNLAVLTDAMGRYDEALKLYDKAIQNGGESWYEDARAGCAKRMQDAQALAN